VKRVTPTQKSLRVLVVEDEPLIALMIEDALARHGHVVIGPISKLDAAMMLAREEHFDAAILDVNIRGGHSFPVAEVLLARGIPFVISSGYADWSLPQNLKDQHRLTKPFSEAQLDSVLASLRKNAANLESTA